MSAQVQLIAGPARCGKTKRLLATYCRQLGNWQTATFSGVAAEATTSSSPTVTDRGSVIAASYFPASPASGSTGECFWIAPNQMAVAQLQASLLETASTALLRPNLGTFAHFAETLIMRSQRRLQPISRAQKRRLLEQAIETTGAKGALEHFARVASTPGFVNQVDDRIAEWKRQDIWPEAAASSAGIDRGARELARIYTAYQQILHRRELYDAEGRFWAAREVLTALTAKVPAIGTPAMTSGGTSGGTSSGTSVGETKTEQLLFDTIVVNGFNDFTASQYDILRLLGERSAQLLISLTVEQPIGEALLSATGHENASSLSFTKTSETLSRLQAVLPQLTIDHLPETPLTETPPTGTPPTETPPTGTPPTGTPPTGTRRTDSRPGQDSLQRLQRAMFREPLVRSQPASSSPLQPLENVEIVAASSELGEIEAIAEQIKDLLFSRQSQPEEIVVVCQGGETMAELIASVFPDYGIPFWSELRPRLESEPLLRALSALLRLQQDDWPFQTLLEVINNGLFSSLDAAVLSKTGDSKSGFSQAGFSKAGDSGSGVAARDELATRELAKGDRATSFAEQPRVAMESCVRSAQLPSGRQALLEQLEYRHNLAAQGKTDLRGRQVAIARAALRRLAQRLARLPTEATIDQWIEALAKLLTELGALQLPSTSGSSTASAWNLLRRGLASIAQVDAWSLVSEQTLTLPELHRLLATVARDQRMPALQEPVGRVRILSAESARKLPIKHLLLAGLTEQAFSSAPPVASVAIESVAIESGAVESGAVEPTASSDPTARLVSRSEPASSSEMATQADVGGAPAESNVRLGDGMLLFYELVTRATQSLTLSYPALDAKGQMLPPSPLLTELERSVGEHRIPRRTIALGDARSRQRAVRSRASWRRQAVDQALVGKQQWLAGMLSQTDFESTGSAILSGIESVAERGGRDGFGPYEGLILSERAQAALAQRFHAEHLWSPSQLESYATCPFRFFSEHLLRLEPLGELALSSDARRRGSLLHQVLATIHQQLGAMAAEPEQDLVAVDLVERFLAALDAAVKATPLRGIEQSLREIERREIEAWAPTYAEQETSYRRQWKHWDQPPTPTCFEVRFGPETRASAGEASDPASTRTPFELDLGDERIRLTGQIDRIDMGRVGQVAVFNIIDYKSGKEVKLKFDKVRAGSQLQLPLYAMAAEQLLLADHKAVALATGYWNIQGKGFESAKGGSLHMRELVDQTLKPSEAWRQLEPAIRLRVQELIGGIRGGQFPVFNEDEQCTRSCSLSTVCRVAQVRSLEKVWPPPGDPLANQQEKTAEGNDGH